ncbi:hypothetical protein SHJG_p1045 (plasmid) [Streptomyces hygroscopicus subsp. jinggangensis 5008]|uniref:hypothetical protein n=1 Tax=Streptomyces sp. NPDC004658 TaxID=3154672 RepID=UPI00024BDFAA|nr:hypothetical protein SHJG_p1045 [Streptomyces hygroscopicus subsp. jinggangensis 5008]AGF68330.1 hypothetical protein SHJGH_p1045 [Streptomyces hygroscopicus subsp. jinggangensis TL01]
MLLTAASLTGITLATAAPAQATPQMCADTLAWYGYPMTDQRWKACYEGYKTQHTVECAVMLKATGVADVVSSYACEKAQWI